MSNKDQRHLERGRLQVCLRYQEHGRNQEREVINDVGGMMKLDFIMNREGIINGVSKKIMRKYFNTKSHNSYISN